MNRLQKKSATFCQNLPAKRTNKKSLLRDYSAKLLPLAFIFPLATGYILAPGLMGLVRASLEDSPKTVVDEVWQRVNSDFVDKKFNQVDWRQKRQELLSKNYPSQENAYKAIQKALAELGDPHTRFLHPEEYKSLNERTTGELSGIGIRLKLEAQTGDLKVIKSLDNSPADRAGIKAGDTITKINDMPTALMSLEQASAQLQGEVGTKVKLEIAREGQKTLQLNVTRDRVELPSVSYALKQEGSLKVGYIKLDEFSSHSAKQMKGAITDLAARGVNSYVLDLRGNPGGLLFSSVDIARMWLDDGTIVYMDDRKGGEREFSANNTALTNLPLVVLVDGNSASSSEILAGALKDNDRAKIVGTRTYGKGTVQSVYQLSDGSGLVLTISRYYPPSRIDINKHGIEPHIEKNLSTEEKLNLTANPALMGTDRDTQYQSAIELLRRDNTISSF